MSGQIMNDSGQNVRKARKLLVLYTLYKIINGADPWKAVLNSVRMDYESAKRVAARKAAIQARSSIDKNRSRPSLSRKVMKKVLHKYKVF